jgi:hypothetical protein
MIKKTAVLLLLLCASFWSRALELKYANYDWVADPKPHVLSDKDKALPELVLFEKHAMEFFYVPVGKSNELQEFKLYHIIIRVNSDEAITRNNRLYIPSNSSLEFLKQKARVISPTGKVKILSEENIKEAEDEKSHYKYKYFAIEGIQMGSEIEYYYLVRISSSYSGNRERLQSTVPKKDLSFELISPVNLHFLSKSYNGLPELVQDTLVIDKIVLGLQMKEMPGLPEESQSAHLADLMQVEYKLNSNSATNAQDITSYGPVCSNLYKSIMAEADKSTKSKVKKMIKEMNLSYAKDDEDRIRLIEDYIKTHVNLVENDNPDLSDLEKIVEKRSASPDAIMKLYAAVFNELKIDYQVVLTANRNNTRFDPDFEAYNFLSEYLIYMPGIGSYFSPSLIFTRLGFPPSYLTNTYGLFIHKVTLNDFETGIGKIKFIDPVSYEKNYDNTNVRVKFGNDLTKPQIQLNRSFGGYYAENIQPYYSYFTEDDKQKSTNSLLKDFLPNTEIKEITVENAGKDFFPIQPFILKANFTCDNLVESSGDKYIFKIGELIGPQMEMYQKEERKTAIESGFSRSYKRQIIFEIPPGFKATNLEALKMDVFTEADGQRVIAFTSSYKLEGNVLTVDIAEYYKKSRFPVEEYENYRKVINASANFNKVNLFLAKVD